MRSSLLLSTGLLSALLFLSPSRAQFPQDPFPAPKEDGPIKLPNGKSQQEEILKEEHRRSLEEADDMIRTAEEVKADLEKNDRHVVSLATLKKLDEVERLSKRIRARLKRY